MEEDRRGKEGRGGGTGRRKGRVCSLLLLLALWTRM